jgi:hypothetical protein
MRGVIVIIGLITFLMAGGIAQAASDKNSEEAAAIKKSEEAAAIKKSEEAAAIKKSEEAAAIKKSEEAAAIKKSEEAAAIKKSEEAAAIKKSEEAAVEKKWAPPPGLLSSSAFASLPFDKKPDSNAWIGNGNAFGHGHVNAVPEPGSIVLIAIGLAGLTISRHRKSRDLR